MVTYRHARRRTWTAAHCIALLLAGSCAVEAMQSVSDRRAASITTPDANTLSLHDLVPDAPRVALPVPAADNVGTAGVEGGAATYTIDIPVPPGRRGMQPDVALTYSSRAAGGIAGVGWSLAATSSIHRCPRTVAQDGQTRGVDFSLHDRVCLDGRRLVLVRGR